MWRLGVAGSPVAHSLSPRLHEAGLAMAGLDGTSVAIEVAATEVAKLGELLGTSVDALSLTMPLKSAAVALCDEVDETSRRVGAVNSVLVRGGRLWGANTDGAGFVESLAYEFGLELCGARVLVLGAGGAARAIVDALAGAGVASVEIEARRTAPVDWLAAHYDVVRRGTRGDPLELVVNTTPVEGRIDRLARGAGPATVAVDITYEPRMTQWRFQYERNGCRTTNGLAMLAFQAARQMSWWFDVPIDGAALLASIS